jgi:signal transduction histidine kinase
MASVLRSEMFGNLTAKQKEYLEIVHTSGQQMNSLVDEILKLGVAEENGTKVQLTPVNLEMLCQQAITSILKLAKQKRLELRLSAEPGKQIWLLDKDKVQQSLYYLVTSIIESSEAGGEIRIHISRKNQTLNVAVWVFHPWLGDGLPQVDLSTSSIINLLSQSRDLTAFSGQTDVLEARANHYVLTSANLEAIFRGNESMGTKLSEQSSRELLGLLLACHLAENHGGRIMIQGSPETGYRYVLILPKVAADEE